MSRRTVFSIEIVSLSWLVPILGVENSLFRLWLMNVIQGVWQGHACIRLSRNKWHFSGFSAMLFRQQGELPRSPLINPPLINNKVIYDINTLQQYKIKFEQPHPKREIPQYNKCQQYRHMRNFCFWKARCVKCAGDHDTLRLRSKTFLKF